MTRLLRLACVACALAWPSAAQGQETLTLGQAIRQTLARNRALQAAQAGVREADAHVWQARSAYFPRVTVTESWQRGDQPVFVFSSLLSSRQFTAANFAIGSLNEPSPISFFRGAVVMEQVLFDGGRTRASVAAADLRRDIASLSTDEAAASLAVAATEAYGRVLAARVATRAADAAAAAAQEDVTRAILRRDAGSLSDADVLALTVHLADVKQRRIQSAGNEAIAKAELNRLMGTAIDQDYDVQEPAPPATAGDGTPAALFAEAETLRPDLKRMAAAERLSDTARQQARSAWLPQVAAQAGAEADGTRFGDRASSWLVGGEIRWSFSAGGAQLADRAAAIEAASRARIEREDARAAAQVEILTALRRLESARARQTVGQASADQARESQRIIRDRFEAGLSSTNDLLRVAAAVVDAETQRVSALVDVLVSRTSLDRAIGRKP